MKCSGLPWDTSQGYSKEKKANKCKAKTLTKVRSMKVVLVTGIS